MEASSVFAPTNGRTFIFLAGVWDPHLEEASVQVRNRFRIPTALGEYYMALKFQLQLKD